MSREHLVCVCTEVCLKNHCAGLRLCELAAPTWQPAGFICPSPLGQCPPKRLACDLRAGQVVSWSAVSRCFNPCKTKTVCSVSQEYESLASYSRLVKVVWQACFFLDWNKLEEPSLSLDCSRWPAHWGLLFGYSLWHVKTFRRFCELSNQRVSKLSLENIQERILLTHHLIIF